MQILGEDGSRTAQDLLYDTLAAGPRLPGGRSLRSQLVSRSEEDYRQLWPRLEELATAAEQRARDLLLQRGEEEAQAMDDLLARQEKAIHRAMHGMQTLFLQFGDDEEKVQKKYREQREQADRDLRGMQRRLSQIPRERQEEPAAIRKAYEVFIHRFEPVGLVYLWPEV